MAVDILKQRFPNNEIKRYCSGDIRDTKKGIDIVIVSSNKDITLQVKPFVKVESYVEPDGDTFFEVKSYLDANKYSERNVNIFMFVNYETKEFILFKNKKTKIGQMRGNITRFYEPPLYTNMTFVSKQKRRYKNLAPTDSLFDVNTDMLKNLEFRKSQIEKMIGKHSK
jgi:glutamine synthetase